MDKEAGTKAFTPEGKLYNEPEIPPSSQKHQDGVLHEWKRKIHRRATLVLLEVADTGRFEWKLFHSRKVCCAEESLEELRQQYLSFLRTQNLENRTIALYDYAFRSMIEGLGIGTVTELAALKPKQVQGMAVFLSGKLNLMLWMVE